MVCFGSQCMGSQEKKRLALLQRTWVLQAGDGNPRLEDVECTMVTSEGSLVGLQQKYGIKQAGCLLRSGGSGGVAQCSSCARRAG